MRRISKGERETARIAKIFLKKILSERAERRGALVIALSGDLGAGKTTFAKAAAKHFRIKEKVSSPTFVILKKYPVKLKGYKFFFHLDAYRLKNEKELLRLGWGEIISDKSHLIFLEWPENVKKIIPSDAKFICLSHNKNGQRNLELK